MFLFVAVQSLQEGIRNATEVTATDRTLVVYRENRYCPATSRLPEHYAERISRIDGVTAVVPIKVVVNNCATSLDVVTFRGIPSETVSLLAPNWHMLAGSMDDWQKRSDAALVGENLASRRGFKVGQTFNSAGVSVTVAGIFRSSEAQDQNAAYVHLPFLQQVAAKAGIGIVTQFNVRVSDPTRLEEIAANIDADFRTEAEPTQTRTEKAFVAQAGSDIVEIIAFTRYLGLGCLSAVLGLVANAIVLGVQDRIKEHAVLQTLGFRSGLIARLIIAEGMLMGVLGGGLGTFLAVSMVSWGNFSISNEGQSVPISASPAMFAIGFLMSAGVGVAAGLVPAWRASRREIAHCFRAI
ncbi:MAG: FtsX-like permease family protein [Phycisphaerae bacterium]|nr:FtsX-like permease family protein [Phycisphaerae bacterium]